MTTPVRRIYPNEQRILFDGGLNNKFQKNIIEDNESPDCLNVVFTNGSVETRPGIKKLNTTAVGSFVGDGLYTRRTDAGAETMIVFAGGSAWQLATTTFSTIPSGQSVFTAGVRVAATQYQNYMFIGNGGITPYKYNGAFTRHGVPAPTVTGTVTSIAVGVLTGDYQYRITFINSGLVEGDVGPKSATFAAAGATLRLSSIQTAPVSHGVNARRVYRTAAGGTTFKKVADINDNTTTTYDDNLSDAGLGATAPTDNGEPPKYSAIVYHQNRLFVNDPANPNFVWYSELGQPYTFASTNFIKVGDQASDVVKGLGVYNNSIIVYCEKSLQMIYMQDTTPGNWRTITMKSQYGSKSPFSFFNYQNKQMFAATQNDKFVGFSAVVGDTVDTATTFLTVLTAGSDRQSDRIETDMFSVQEGFLGNISSIVFKEKAYIALTFGTSNTTNNRFYTFDFSYSNISKDQKSSWVPNTGTNPAQFTIYGGHLYYISSTATGFVYQLDTSQYNDDGAAINSYYWTKEFSGFKGELNFTKDFRYSNLLLSNLGAFFMNLVWRIDSDMGSGNTIAIDLNPGGSLWGTMTWGSSLWGGGTDQRDVKEYLLNSSGKRIQFQFNNQNVANQRFRVAGLNFAYNLKGYR